MFLKPVLVILLGLSLPKIVHAEEAKAFAVFVASYHTDGEQAVGGVAGTAFFVSAHKAVTAFHVLQPKSFRPAAGFERIRVWLVHEGYPALEVKPEALTYKTEQDSTIIEFGDRVHVPSRFVYATDHVTPLSAQVESEGFMANSAGPMLERRGADLVITAVPKLERLHLSGRILRQSAVSLQSADLHLRAAECVQLSYQPIKGFSGGPVIANGKVIGMNSFADPESGRETWALQVTRALLN